MSVVKENYLYCGHTAKAKMEMLLSRTAVPKIIYSKYELSFYKSLCSTGCKNQ